MDRTYKLDILFKVLEFLIKASLTLCFCKGTGVVYSDKLFDLGELITTDDDTDRMYRAHSDYVPRAFGLWIVSFLITYRVHSGCASRAFRLSIVSIPAEYAPINCVHSDCAFLMRYGEVAPRCRIICLITIFREGCYEHTKTISSFG